MYKVICSFADLLDRNHVYREGDTYPRSGYTPSSDRIDELSTSRNRTRRPLIELVKETVVQAVVEDPKEVVGAVVEESNAVVEEPKTEATVEKPSRGRKKSKNASNTN